MKEFARYVTLSILGQLGISCYIIADTFFISKGLGANGLTAVLSAAFVLTGLFGAGKLALLLGANEATLEMTTTYLRWILIFAPAFMLNEVLHCFVRNDDAPNLVMFATLAGSFANIILVYIFIFPMNMGILGAVLATGSSPVFSILLMMPHWLKKKNTFHFVKTGILWTNCNDCAFSSNVWGAVYFRTTGDSSL